MKEININNNKFFVTESLDPKHNKYWDSVNAGRWEPNTFKILDKFINNDSTCIDLGAWVGSTVLYSANRAKHVYTAEPDPAAITHLKANIKANPGLVDKITLYEGVISKVEGKVSLATRKNVPFGRSGSTLLIENERAGETVEVASLSFESFVNHYNINYTNFVKMDIEGAESFVLPSMTDFISELHPTLYISIHPWGFNEESLAEVKEVLSVYEHIYDTDTFNKININDILNFNSILVM